MKLTSSRWTVRLLSYYTLAIVFGFSNWVVANDDDDFNLLASCQLTETRVDCHPEPAANELECTRRNCCWLKDTNQQNGSSYTGESQNLPLVSKPDCFFPSNFRCYQIKRIKPRQEKQDGPQRSSNLDDKAQKKAGTTIGGGKQIAHNGAGDSSGSGYQQVDVFKWLLIRSSKCPASGFVDDATKLIVEVGVYGESLINIKISEPDRQRFAPALPEIKLPIKSNSNDYFNHKNNNEQLQSNAQYDDDGGGGGGGSGGGGGNGNSSNDDLVVEEPETLSERLTTRRLVSIELQAPASIGSDGDYYEPQTAAGVLRVIHQMSGVVLFEADLGKLIYSRQFIQLPTYLPPWSLVYGLGQHMGTSLLKSSGGSYAKSYTMFNYGHPPQMDGRTAYSSYPFYINLAQLNNQVEQSSVNAQNNTTNTTTTTATTTNNNNNNNNNNNQANNYELKRKLIATGGFMLNSGPVDVLLHSNNGYKTGLTWRLISGIVDLYLFMGPKPHDVVGQYQSLVGVPNIPPAWSLGYHQSRHNYLGLMQIKLAWARSRSSGIPMESIWTDVDFLWRGTSYTVNNEELNELVEVLQNEYGMHYVSIVDPAISVNEELDIYKPLKLAREMNIFPTNPDNSLPTVITWTESRRSALIDFTHPNITHYLKQVLGNYKTKLNYDGIWLDMNEPEVFANVEDSSEQVCSSDETLQYLPGARKLYDKTMCMATKFHLGTHLDLHNLYAFYQSKAHYETLKILNPSRRPFILSRSQFAGQGKYSAAWLGDLGSTFEHMQWSLLGVIESNWFGQPHVGADICGFFGSTTDELCARWFSLGAFYTFSRNHNHGSARDQDPGSLSEMVQLAARLAMIRRYSLLPYLYTLFYDNHFKKLPVIRSILFESFDQFMTDTKLRDLPQIDDQFMWGSAIMFAPILKLGADSRSVYLPPGTWYDISIGLPGTDMREGLYDALKSNWPLHESMETIGMRSKKRIDDLRRPIECKTITGCWLEDVYTPIGSINIYLKGGQIIPTFKRVNHEDSVGANWRNAAFFLEAALDKDQGAFGSLFWDSGESEVNRGANHQAIFWIQANKLVISAIEDGYEEPMKFDGFVIYGLNLAKQTLEDQLYKGVKLVYEYKADTRTLSCLFKSPSADELEYLSLKRFERLEFEW